MAGKIVRTLLLLIACFKSLATFAGDGYGVTVYHTRGVFWAHRKTILQLEAPTRGVDVTISLFTKNGKKQWPASYRYPRVGLSLSYLNMGLPEITGNAFGILPYLELRIIHTRRQELSFLWGTGIGYLSKKWDMETNITNRAIGTHFNANMRGHLTYHHYLPKGFELSAIAGITHYSNGNIKLPNLGVNCLEVGIGFGYTKGDKSRSPKVRKDTMQKKPQAFEIRLAGGTKETNLIYTKRIYPVTLAGRYFFYQKNVSRFHAGLEFFFDQGRLYRDNPADVTEKPNVHNSLDIGIHLGHDVEIGRLHFIMEAGGYIYSPTYFKGIFYQRLGFKYCFTPKWNASLALKTHFSRADLFEWGIGYTFIR